MVVARPRDRTAPVRPRWTGYVLIAPLDRDTVVSAPAGPSARPTAQNPWIFGRFGDHGMVLAVVRPTALMLAPVAALASCLITRTDEVRVPTPVTAPRIQDIQGITTPRLGALLETDEIAPGSTPVTFRVPVDDDGVDDPLQYQFFVNADRDCVPRGEDTSCEPGPRLGQVNSNGMRRRFVERVIQLPEVGCNRVELYVSSRLRLSGNFRTPEREGDVDFRTWWIFVRPRSGAVPSADGGLVDAIRLCPYLVQP